MKTKCKAQTTGIIKIIFKILLIASFAAIFMLYSSTVMSQDIGSAKMRLLRNAVVNITVVRQDGTVHHGFGIVIGEYKEFSLGTLKEEILGALIITANHLVRDANGSNPPQKVEVRFFKEPGVPAREAFALDQYDAGLDVAVLAAETPRKYKYEWAALGCITELKAGDPVLFIGRGGKWYMQDPPGKFIGVDNYGQMTAEGLNVLRGSSGGPMLSERGIVAMLISDSEGLRSKGTSMDRIRELVVEEWDLGWGLYRAFGQLPCRTKFVGTKQGVELFFGEMYQPTTPVSIFVEAIVPVKRDCAKVFSSQYVDRAKAYFRNPMGIRDVPGAMSLDNFYTLGIIDVMFDEYPVERKKIVAECKTTDELKQGRIGDYEKKGEIVKPGLMVCFLGPHPGRKDIGPFIYVNGRWKFFEHMISFIKEVSPYKPPRRWYDPISPDDVTPRIPKEVPVH